MIRVNSSFMRRIVTLRSLEQRPHHTKLSLDFRLERPQKTLHCAEPGVTHFIDDRRDLLEAMQAFVELATP